MTKPVKPRTRPVSYGGERRAREYVTLLLETAKTTEPGLPIYLTVSPVISGDSEKWGVIIRTLRELVPGIPFRHWPLIAKTIPSGKPGERADWIISQHSGNIIIADREQNALKVGLMALLESTRFDAAGKPVLVFTGTRLVAWPDCHVHKIPEQQRKDPRIAATIALPVRSTRPLPTLAASFHVLGIRDPDIIAYAAGTVTARSAGSRSALSPRFLAPPAMATDDATSPHTHAPTHG